MTAWPIVLAAALSSSTAPPTSSSPPPTSVSSHSPPGGQMDWVEGPEAPPSTAPLPPAVAPREGDAPQEVLVVPPIPPEDTRVVVDDHLLRPLQDLRLQTTIDRRTLTSSSFLDLDSALAGAGVPGVTWLTSSSGAARPVARGHRPGQLGVVVDGVPLLTEAFGVSVAPSELVSPVAIAGLTFEHGPRAFSPSSSQAGVLQVDTGGSLTALGDTTRADGLLAAGVGGSDVESGATTLVRTGWHTLRVLGHGTVLHRQDQRPGRVTVGVPPLPSSTEILPHSGGSGGVVGARVDATPFERSRLFVSYLAGRSIDVPDPARCGEIDPDRRSLDCVRAKERGADVGIVGVDVVRDVAGLRLQPMARVHLQRALSVDERSGRALTAVDIARDEVVRGGGIVGVTARAPAPLIFDLVPALDVAIDARADRASSSFASRSVLRRNGAPPGDGAPDPLRARAIDGAVAREGLLRTRLRLDSDDVALAVSTRFQVLQVQAPAVTGPAGDPGRGAVDVVSFSPSIDASARLRLTTSVSTFIAVGSIDRGEDPAALVAGPGHGPSVTPSAPGTTRGSERFGEVGVAVRSAAVDVDTVAFGSLRAPAVVAGDAPRGDDGATGLEGRVTLKPGIDGVTFGGSLAGVVVDSDVFGAGRDAASGVIQPQGQLQLRYEPSAWPMGFYARVHGAFPQPRLSQAEQQDPQLCPERPADENTPQDRPCSGAPAFASVDVGAFLQLGQLRADLGGENIFDHANRWQGATLGTGGAAVRLRIAFLF